MLYLYIVARCLSDAVAPLTASAAIRQRDDALVIDARAFTSIKETRNAQAETENTVLLSRRKLMHAPPSAQVS